MADRVLAWWVVVQGTDADLAEAGRGSAATVVDGGFLTLLG